MRKEEDVSRETHLSENDQQEEVADPDPMRIHFRKLSEAEQVQMVEIKNLGHKLLFAFDRMGSSREISIAKTRLEEAIMWSIKHLTA